MRHQFTFAGLAFAGLILAAACTKEAPPAPAPTATAAAAAEPSAIMTLMKGTIDPAATTASNFSGLDDEGKPLAADSPLWAEASAAAQVIIDNGPALLDPANVRHVAADDTDWVTHANEMVAAATRLKAAIDGHKSADEIGAAGGDLYTPCSSCHTKFPSAANANAVPEPGPTARLPE
jgi:cytochrome c556